MRNNIIDFIKFYSIRFYITFLLYFGPIVYPLEFFYSNHKYPILIFLIAIFLLLRYNLSFSNFIKKYDTIKIPLLKKKYYLDDYVSFSMFFFFFLVYLWYFTINITLSIQMLYLTAFMFISGKLFIYLRYQKNPSKYK